MNALMTLVGSLPDPTGAPFLVSLVARLTVFLAVAWCIHAALARRNPRWRVSLWRGVAVGAVVIPIVVCAPPVVRWRLPGVDRPRSLARTDAPEVDADAPGRPHRGEGEQTSSPLAESGAESTRSLATPRMAPTAGANRASSRFEPGPWVLGVWAAGVIVLAIHHVRQTRRLGAIIGRAERVPDELVAEWGAGSTAAAVAVLRSAEVPTPCLARAWRPVLLLPDQLCPGHHRAEMRAIVAHELAHARGHDLAWNEALRVVSMLFWFHPLVWRAREAHASACDAVCDAVAADQLDDVAAYSQALARLALRAARAPLAGGLAMARVSDVRRRIESLNRRVFRSPLPRRLIAPACLVFGLGVLLIGGLGFTRAGEPPAATQKAAPQPASRTGLEPQPGNGTATLPAMKLSAWGTVVDAGGKPVAGATVFLREWTVIRVQGMKPDATARLFEGEGMRDVLAETKTDGGGRFRFEGVAAPGFSEQELIGRQPRAPWDLVAMAPGHGLGWVQLTRSNQATPVTLTLEHEWTVRGRVVEPGGQPIAGAKVQVFGIDPLGRLDGNGLGTENRLNLIWSTFPLNATTGADGQFTIAGLPRDRVATLVVTDHPRHERLIVFAATTDVPQPDNVQRRFSSGGEPYEFRLPVQTGPLTLTAKRTDHVLTGRVVFEADGKPAAGARVFHRSMPRIADGEGRYRIEGLTSGPLELHAIASGTDTVPVDLNIELPEEPKEIERDLVLPRGLVLTGRVVDATTGRGVAKTSLRFNPRTEVGQTRTIFGFSCETDADGHFRLAVPPGRGTVQIESIPPDYPPMQRRMIGEALDAQSSRAVEGQKGQTVEVAEFRLTRAAGIVLQVFDPDGRPVPGAQVEIRDIDRWPSGKPGRTGADGRYEVAGLAPGRATVIDIIADNPRLGATVEVDTEKSRGDAGLVKVELMPLVTLAGRVLDEEGRPIVGPIVQLYRDVMYPGQSGRSFGVPVETRNEVAADGTYTFDRLIPGATYNTAVGVEGYPRATSRHLKIKPGQPARLEDFRLPAANQAVRGIVVDPRGNPVSGATVSYDRHDRTQGLYAPEGAVWFHGTDVTGRFRLTGLPRGPIRLMVYRRPEAGQSIRDPKYVDVPPGQAEVRIELPDPNDRLRGID